MLDLGKVVTDFLTKPANGEKEKAQASTTPDTATDVTQGATENPRGWLQDLAARANQTPAERSAEPLTRSEAIRQGAVTPDPFPNRGVGVGIPDPYKR